MVNILKIIGIILLLIIIFLVGVLIFMHMKYEGADAWGHFFQFLYDIS